MRLAGQAKLGYYPIAPEAITLIRDHLVMPTIKADEVNVIDPCAGEGAAIRLLSESLGIKPDRTYAVELDAGRSAACRENLPGGNVVGPASFLGTQITGYSFGLAYLNPPFDDELGGGRREEHTFAEKATRLLVPRGILVLVMPLVALEGKRDFVRFLDSYYEDIRVFKLPTAIRHYNEIVLFGRKRKMELPGEATYSLGELHKAEWHYRSYGWDERLSTLGDATYNQIINGRVVARVPHLEYNLPSGYKPNTFKKVNFAEGELEAALERSPLNALLTEYVIPPVARPPLPLGNGHVALLMASGMLDGAVQGPDGPHVVRGTSKKIEYISERKSTENEETGAVTEKVTYSQKIVLTLRAVSENGDIKTFSDEPVDKEGSEDGDDGDDDESSSLEPSKARKGAKAKAKPKALAESSW